MSDEKSPTSADVKVKELYKDPAATKRYWDDSWSVRNYEEMLRFELGSFSQRATVDKFIQACSIRDGGSVLDIGCGWGRIIIGMLNRLPNLQMHGIDVSQEAIERGFDVVSRMTGKPVDMQVARAEFLPFDNELFDAVISTRVWQYITDPQRAMNEVGRVLKPGGAVTVMAPNARNPIRARGYHTQLLTVEQIANWMRSAELEVTGSGTIVFAPPKTIRFSDRSLWVHVERVLERIPGIRRIGGLAWVSGQKKRSSAARA